MSNDRADTWTASWVKEKITNHDKVASIKAIDSNLITVVDNKNRSFQVATMSLKKISATDLRDLIETKHIDFVLNVSKEPYIFSDALEFAADKGFAIGGLGDVMRALNDGNFSGYVNPEIAFILRGLRQHSKVTNVFRLDNRRFQINRKNLPTVTILALNDYDLTADSIRTAIDDFPSFDAILTSNPNCRRSGSSITVSESAGIKLLAWGELLGELNKQWT